MPFITRDKFNSLANLREPWCVSIYMPTHTAGPEVRQDPIRFKNLLTRAEEQMERAGLRASEAREKTAELYQLLENADFWRHQGQGLAIFLHKKERDVYRLPLVPPELVVVGDKLHLKPLLPLVTRDVRFYILALGQNSVKFYEATEFDFTQVQIEGMPASYSEAMKYLEVTQALQFHTRTPMPGAGMRSAMFFGHGNEGVDARQKKMRLAEYCRLVDCAVSDWLGGDTAPLVLASADPLIGIYREVNTYRHLHPEPLPGNPEKMDPRSLHSGSMTMLKETVERDQRKAASKYHSLVGTGLASNNLETVIKAAFNQQIESLFVSISENRWGKFNSEDFTVELHDEQMPNDDDLLDLAASAAFQNGAAVYPVDASDMPNGEPLAAVFRFGEEISPGAIES